LGSRHGHPAGWPAFEWLHLEEFLVTKESGIVDSKIHSILDTCSIPIDEIEDIEVWGVGIWD
jgi:hypothetical protein